MASISAQLQLPDRSAAMLPADRAAPESAYFIFYVNLRSVRCAASRRCGKSRGSPLEAAVVSNSSDLRAAVAAGRRRMLEISWYMVTVSPPVRRRPQAA